MSSKKLAVVFGHRGMLGHEIVDAFDKSKWMVATPESIASFLVDISDQPALNLFFDRVDSRYDYARIDAVVNAAAYTDVDACEFNECTAYDSNCLGPKYIAEICIRRGVKMFVHVSTDYVYCENSCGLLCPGFNIYNPVNAYGRTKLAGDFAVAAAYGNARASLKPGDDIKYTIARTSRLFGRHRHSFVDFVCDNCLSHVNGGTLPDSLRPLMNSNITIPTSAKFVADSIVKICDGDDSCIDRWNSTVNLVSRCGGTEDAPTLYGYANAIYEILEELGEKPYRWFVKSEKTFYEPSEVPRPRISTMATSIANAPHWRAALKDYIMEKMKNGNIQR